MSFEELEKCRENLKKNYIIVLSIGFILIIWMLIGAIFKNIIIYLSITFILVIALMFFASKQREKRKKFNSAFKDYFIIDSLKDFFTDIQYMPEKGFTYSMIESTNMFYMGNRFHSEDYISAKYKNIQFEQADVRIEKVVNHSDDHVPTTIFEGKWIIFEFDKAFKTNIQIIPGYLKKLELKWGKKKDDGYIQMETKFPEFNKKFTVRVQNELEASFILTSTVIQKIEKLAEKNEAGLYFYFIDNKLHIGLNNFKDSFEPIEIKQIKNTKATFSSDKTFVYKPIDENAVKKNILKDIKDITQFIDELILDSDLPIK